MILRPPRGMFLISGMYIIRIPKYMLAEYNISDFKIYACGVWLWKSYMRSIHFCVSRMYVFENHTPPAYILLEIPVWEGMSLVLAFHLETMYVFCHIHTLECMVMVIGIVCFWESYLTMNVFRGGNSYIKMYRSVWAHTTEKATRTWGT